MYLNAHELQIIIDKPSTKDPTNIIDRNLIPNCPMMIQTILRAEDIFGPNLGSLNVRMTHTTQGYVRIYTYNIPPEIME